MHGFKIGASRFGPSSLYVIAMEPSSGESSHFGGGRGREGGGRLFAEP